MKVLVLAALIAIAPAPSQKLDLQGNVSTRDRQYVSYTAQQQTVTAGKRTVLELHFRVADGFHVNSHTPKSELLIPTEIGIEPDGAVKAADAVFPAGSTFSFDFDPNNKLDVYQGSFTVQLPVTASAGAHALRGNLRYQACNRAQCFPPRSLGVVLEFVAKS